MNYFLHHKTKEGYVYSCDKICVVGKIIYSFLSSFGFDISSLFERSLEYSFLKSVKFPWESVQLADYVFFNKYGAGDYRNNINVKLSNGSSFWFGFAHNSDSNCSISWKLELNPNKCMPCEFVFVLLDFLKFRTKVSSLRVSQFDLAIDFPIERNSFYLNKDKRLYSLINDGLDNITEYLSKHNSHGFTKLYNKAYESKLKNTVLTRLEITLKKFCIKDVLDCFPSVHIYDKTQITLNEQLSDLSDNDSVFIDLLRLHPEYFDKLTYRKRQKFAPYLNYDAPVYQLDVDIYNKLYLDIKKVFIECPIIE